MVPCPQISGIPWIVCLDIPQFFIFHADFDVFLTFSADSLFPQNQWVLREHARVRGLIVQRLPLNKGKGEWNRRGHWRTGLT